MDVEHLLALVKTFHGAHHHAIGVLASEAWLGNNVSHGQVSPFGVRQGRSVKTYLLRTLSKSGREDTRLDRFNVNSVLRQHAFGKKPQAHPPRRQNHNRSAGTTNPHTGKTKPGPPVKPNPHTGKNQTGTPVKTTSSASRIKGVKCLKQKHLKV
jgi:hypothetical protein